MGRRSTFGRWVLVIIVFLLSVTLFISCEDPWYAELEPNDSYAEATPFPSNNKISGRLPDPGDRDYFHDLIYRGETVTYTLKDWTEPLQLMLYYTVPTDESSHDVLLGVDRNVNEGPAQVSITYPQNEEEDKFDMYPSVDYLEVYVLVEPASEFETSSSYWLTKVVL